MKIFLSCITVLAFALVCKAENSDTINFAQWLKSNGEYDRAVDVYLKLIYDNPSNDVLSYSILRVSECYLEKRAYEDAIKWSRNQMYSISPLVRDSLRIMLGHAYLRLDEYSKAENIYFGLASKENTNLKDEAYFWAGVAKIHQLEFRSADSSWEQISPLSKYFGTSRNYLSMSNKLQRLNLKNPNTGATLGTIPGLGYYYAEHEQTAISAAIVIGLMSWGTVKLLQNDNYGFGLLSGFITIGWYSGSIYGSYKAVQRSNWQKYNSILSKISRFSQEERNE
ncbi:hypothetical protein HQ587_03810 [bacterium]|nr:hypothetical protein [bacterium]